MVFQVENIDITSRGLWPLVIWGNASTCAEKKSNPQIASCGKYTYIVDKMQSFNFKTEKRGITKFNVSKIPELRWKLQLPLAI